uniref:Uncharacterized protein n=1 Tax=Meloidogyne enterolobii TaxID=390850 RepID=A0A6V7U8P4_MELEN|nr:unnamed protein product [Meloidogyne enterolobii]
MRHQYKNSEDHLNNLRDWYQRRSADFKSFKYLENKKRHSFTNNLINENEKLKRSLEIENLNFLKEFENKINLINKYKYQQKQQQQKIIQNEEFIFNKNKDLFKYTRKINYLQLKPEDFIEISDEEEEEEAENDENNFVDVETFGNSLTENVDNSSLPLIEQTNFEFNKKSPTISNQNIASSTNSSPIFKWLEYFDNFNSELVKEVKEFQADLTQKQLRQHLSRTLAERINDTSKKTVTNQEIAELSNFFDDLFKGQTMISCRDNFEFKLEKEDKQQNFYAMMTICDRYIEQLKWEAELVDQTRLIIVLLMKNQPFFYEIFCARIVASLVLISFDLEKIINKIDLFEKENSQQTNSALSHWISDEQIIFKLFCKVQLALKSSKIKENWDENQQENFWIKQRGPKLLIMFFEESVKMAEDVPLCSPFVLEEMLKNRSTKSIIRQYPEFSEELKHLYIPTIKQKLIKMEENIFLLEELELNEGIKRILISRQKYLICLLEAEINKFEEKR